MDGGFLVRLGRGIQLSALGFHRGTFGSAKVSRETLAAELRKYALPKQTRDILTRLYDQIPDLMIEAVARARRNLRRSKVSPMEFVQALRRQKLVRFTSKIEPCLAEL
jgi:hypothetical protein